MVRLSGDRSLFGPGRPPRSHQFCLHGAAPVRLAGPAYAPLAGWGQAPVCPAGPPPVSRCGTLRLGPFPVPPHKNCS